MTNYRTYILGKDAVFYDKRALSTLKQNLFNWFRPFDWLCEHLPTLARYCDENAGYIPLLPTEGGRTISFTFRPMSTNLVGIKSGGFQPPSNQGNVISLVGNVENKGLTDGQ